MAAYGGHHPAAGPRGYQPRPRSDHSCLLIGILLGGIGLIGFALLVVGGFVIYRAARSAPLVAEQESSGGSDEELGEIYDEGELEALKRRYDAEREQQRIRELTPPETLDEAIESLRSNSDLRREIAARWLRSRAVERSKKQAVAEALIQTLRRTASADVKLEAIHALRQWGSPSVAEELAQIVRTSRTQDEVVRTGLDLLGEYRQPETIDELTGLLGSRDHGQQAADILATFGRGRLDSIVREIDVTDEVAMEHARQLFSQMGENVDARLLDLLLLRLEDSDQQQAGDIAAQLAELETDPSRRDEVAQALDRWLVSTNPYVEKVLDAISNWGTEENAPSLIRLADDRRYRENEQLIEILARLRPPEAVDILVAAMKKDGNIGRLASDALEAMGDPARSAVLRMYNDENEQVRDRARRVLRRCDATNLDYAAQCLKDLDSTSGERRLLAVQALARLDVEPDLQSEVAAGLARAAEDDDFFSNIREPALEALEVWATATQIEPLLRLLDNRDEEVWTAAFRILVELKAYNQMSIKTAAKLESFFDREKTGDLMRRIGPAAEPLAIMMLDHSDEDALKEICEVLAEIGGADSVEPLGRFAEYAARINEREIAFAANLARRAAQERAAAQRQDDQGDGRADGQDDTPSDDRN